VKLSPRVLMGLVLVGVAAATAVVVVLAIGLGGGSDAPSRSGQEQIQATAALTPRAALFGDTVTAKVDVTFDRTQYSPRDVHVLASFAPWETIGAPVVDREDAGSITYLRTTYILRCLEIRCVPTHGATLYQFRPARVVYERPAGDTTERLAVDTQWPALVLHSRLDSSGPTERDALAAPWRADTVSLPAVTYRMSPGWLIALFLLAGVALVAAAGVLAYRARPRRLPPSPPPPPPPPPRLAPLEQALALLEAPPGDGDGGIAERRRALELVADEVSTWGDAGLERDARRLAWSEEDPASEDTKVLAASVRAHAEEAEESDVQLV
jgi:hypothetical protein